MTEPKRRPVGYATIHQLYGNAVPKSIMRILEDMAARQMSVTVRAAYLFGDWPPKGSA